MRSGARAAWRVASGAATLLARAAWAAVFLLRLAWRLVRRIWSLLWKLLRRLSWIDDAAKAVAGFGARLAALPGISSGLRFYRGISPLTRSVLAVNVFALAILGGGFLYLGQYQDGLIAANIDALETQGQIFGAALGEGAVGEQPQIGVTLAPEVAREMIRRLVEPTLDTRARVYDLQGNLIADTNVLRGGPGGLVEISVLPPPNPSLFERLADRVYAGLVWLLPAGKHYPPYVEPAVQTAAAYPEVARALSGEISSVVQSDREYGGLVITVAVPVQRYRQVLGVVQLSTGSTDIDAAVRSVRFQIIKVFGFALIVTVLLSLYLAGTIARPIRRLAAAAERVRKRPGRDAVIPDLTQRGDEIGELSGALRDMTAALWQRMEAIEHFAADVSHEIKNPITSLKSAIETVARIDDPVKQKRLLALVMEDIDRLNRLVTDISNASRLDAELFRDEFAPVRLDRLLAALVEVYESATNPASPKLILTLQEGELAVPGIEDRLVQVFRNLIENAVSFSPPGGSIRISARRVAGFAEIVVEDDGPGIPPGKLEAIFDRFYSERPSGEKFGTHSGLGLSISKQIVETHRGTLKAENRIGAQGRVAGARFIVRLPAG
ncbi:MAG TPA: stimulus-sensing domain-containing protein [Stellaceae bacterium]|nr:stimulus-sensing domain-containing protein [Stellaceae bacterium]